MGSAGKKRHTSSPGTQSQSNIFIHNKRLRLQFLQQVNELKAGSVTKDFKAIIAKRRELFGIIERLRQVPIEQLYSSPLPKSSDARLGNFGKIGSSYSPDNVIDLDADEGNVEYHTQVNAGNTEAGSTASAVDSGDKDRVKSFGDENSSSNQNDNYIQQNPLLEHTVGHQEIIRPDNCNSSTEPQALVKQVNDGMDNDDVSAEVCSACCEYTYCFYRKVEVVDNL
jgi:DNA repair and recombination RAD54-like protein